MNTYFCKNLLLILPIVGLLWGILLFGLCFLGVHILKLARIGLDTQKLPTTQKETEKKEEEKKAPAVQEPVYYIVERKTRRAKSTYTQPKEFRFK